MGFQWSGYGNLGHFLNELIKALHIRIQKILCDQVGKVFSFGVMQDRHMWAKVAQRDGHDPLSIR